MKWAFQNCTKEEFEKLFKPKVSEMNSFVDSKFNELKGVEAVLAKAPGLEVNKIHTTLSISFNEDFWGKK